MENVYVFSGLGVDERVFGEIDFGTFKPVFIQWIKPENNESIEAYAQRLTNQINTKKPILIGLSFGGMIAIEVARYINTRKIILLASAKIYTEIPFYYRWAGYLAIHKLLPITLLKQHTFISDWLFGISDKQHKNMFANILQDLDEDFLKWAINKILCWKNQTIHPNTIHIHGTADKILPAYFIKTDVVVQGGGHFMTVNRAKEISIILQNSMA